MQIIKIEVNFKIILLFTIINLLCLFNLHSCFEISNNKNTTHKLEQNQNKAYPNTNEALTSKTDFKKNSYKRPLLSKALDEQNPKMSIKRSKFHEIIKSKSYSLSRGELEQIFNIIDTQKRDKITFSEWEDFKTLFILPFEACNDKDDYLLDKTQLKTCFEADPKFKFIEFRRRDKHDVSEKILHIISNRADLKLNFHKYLFFKKALFAWTKCQSHGKYISVSSFKCAMEIVVNLHKKIIMKEIYDIALLYQFNDNSLIAPDFINFLNIAHMAYYHSIISFPNKHEFLERNTFLKAFEEDRLPMNFDKKEIKMFYEIIDTNKINEFSSNKNNKVNYMNFRTFCFFFHFHNLFNKYSVKKPSQLDKNELLKLLDDKLIPAKIVISIDNSIVNLKESDHLEGSLIHQTKRLNEAKFFSSFLDKNEISIF